MEDRGRALDFHWLKISPPEAVRRAGPGVRMEKRARMLSLPRRGP
ncbi:hypothetical protein Ga0080574_TMP1088 [Salipiger abyssi]|uniref:Uncharacterized protein n=1 Tax=Salipiger abyssi TaxID=1250539 RepID=A0A1P8UPU4_9RHOB|nr:hypothetical protein Ga0080574_TMP1088 [Salipiger abyssi]